MKGTSGRQALTLFPLACRVQRYANQELLKDRKAVGVSKGTYLRVHFKNTRSVLSLPVDL